jgi:hypothetical protein
MAEILFSLRYRVAIAVGGTLTRNGKQHARCTEFLVFCRYFRSLYPPNIRIAIRILSEPDRAAATSRGGTATPTTRHFASLFVKRTNVA